MTISTKANLAVLEAMLRGVEASVSVVTAYGGEGETTRLLQLSSERTALKAAIAALAGANDAH